jgi:hypothetical protein
LKVASIVSQSTPPRVDRAWISGGVKELQGFCDPATNSIFMV